MKKRAWRRIATRSANAPGGAGQLGGRASDPRASQHSRVAAGLKVHSSGRAAVSHARELHRTREQDDTAARPAPPSGPPRRPQPPGHPGWPQQAPPPRGQRWVIQRPVTPRSAEVAMPRSSGLPSRPRTRARPGPLPRPAWRRPAAPRRGRGNASPPRKARVLPCGPQASRRTGGLTGDFVDFAPRPPQGAMRSGRSVTAQQNHQHTGAQRGHQRLGLTEEGQPARARYVIQPAEPYARAERGQAQREAVRGHGRRADEVKLPLATRC
jgi:hypothetical protein